MRLIKIIFGIGFLIGSLLSAGVALVLFSILDGRHSLEIILVALFFLAASISLFFSGRFLIARRNLRMSWKSIVLICLSFCWFGLCMAIAIPNFVKARATSSSNACLNNLRQIDGAINQWALENGKNKGAIVTEDDIKSYIKLNSKGKIPKCPDGGKYTYGKVGDDPQISCSLSTAAPGHALP